MTLFFTEMWERFSYYGMRGLLVLFMIDSVRGGLGFEDSTATAIYGIYTAAVYLVCLPGGWIADHLIGQQRSVWYGGIVIMVGHFTLALPGVFPAIPHTEIFYLGLMFIVAGTGLLKPNISAIVGQLYPDGGARRDAGFSVFYMGINLGATMGPLVCSFLGEKINWHYGFGAAGVGMLLGLIQYKLTERHLGGAGKHPAGTGDALRDAEVRRRGWKILWGGLALFILVVALLVSGTLPMTPTILAQGLGVFIVGVAAIFFLWVMLFGRLSIQERKHVVVIAIFFVGAAIFWSGFEQAGSTLNLFAKRYTDRSFLGSWFTPSPEFEQRDFIDPAALTGRLRDRSDSVSAYVWDRMSEEGRDALSVPEPLETEEAQSRGVLTDEFTGLLGGEIIYDSDRFAGVVLSPQTQELLDTETQGDRRARLNRWLLEDAFPEAILRHAEKPGEHPAGYYQSINPLFIILLAPFFASFWVGLARRNLEPSAPMKFAIGFVQLGLGFGVMAVASILVLRGGEAGKVLPTWLLFTYLLHTTGELCLSPIGLSWVTKLSPERYVGQMMGTWFMGAALGNLVGGLVAGLFGEESIEQMPERFGMIVITTIGTGLLFALFSRPIRRLIGEVK
jgi:POT family proton-dependent oligopeptide transporter